MKPTALNIAQYIFDQGYTSNLQVNKLLYISFGFFSAKHKEYLFDESIQAWQYGPVVVDVYMAFQKGEFSNGKYRNDLTSDQKASINQVLDFYGKKAPYLLVELTHQKGTPWDQYYQNGDTYKEIPKEAIVSYYNDFLERNKRFVDVFSTDSFKSIMKSLSET